MYEYDCLITSVYDGDTCTGVIDLGFGIFVQKAKLRLVGIDTPEMRGGSAATKAQARSSRDYLRGRVLGKKVRLQSVSKGKYGRYLAILWCLNDDGTAETESLNDALIREGHAKAYDGGSR